CIYTDPPTSTPSPYSTLFRSQVHEADVTKIAHLRQLAKASFKSREGVNLTYLPFFAKAVVEALGVHPNVNASYNEDTKEITYHRSEEHTSELQSRENLV